MKDKMIKIAGVVLPIVVAGLGLAINAIDDKKLDEKVAKKVGEALANYDKES